MNEKKIAKEMRKLKAGEILKRFPALLGVVMMTSMCWMNVAFASNYAQNAYDGFLKENLLWVAIVIILCLIAGNIARKNYVGIVGVLIGGAIVLFLISSPEKLKDLGTTIGNVIFK